MKDVSLHPAPWHHIADQLPDDGEAVIAATSDAEVGEAYMDSGEWFWANGCKTNCEVTHWQKMPAPPAVSARLAPDPLEFTRRAIFGGTYRAVETVA